MRSALVAAALSTAFSATALPSPADATPIAAGASLGRIQSKANADGDASDTWQLFGRIGLWPRLAVQLELARIEDPTIDVRTATALLVVELGRKGRLVPLLVAGFGYDSAKGRDGSYYEASGTHEEGGVGLEYRFDGGLTLGADLRIGGRSVDENYYIQAVEGDVALYAPSGTLVAGEYRSAHVTAAIRF